MKVEIADALAGDYRRLVKERYTDSDISKHVEFLVEMELRRCCAPGYETDGLTGCGSRFLLERDINEALLGSGWNDHSLFSGRYLCVDIDNLKSVNEYRGLLEGDRVLVEVANQIRVAYPGARVYRIGGDGFVAELNALSFVPVRLDSGVHLKYSIVEAHVRQNVNDYLAAAGFMFHLDLGMVSGTEEGNDIVFTFPGNI